MATTIEFEARNVDAALKKASKELDIPVENLRYEVLTAGSSGIFGLVGVKNARIRVFDVGKDTDEDRVGVSAEDRQEILSIVDEAFSDKKWSAGDKKPGSRKAKTEKRKDARSKGKGAKAPSAAQDVPVAPSVPKPEPERDLPEIKEDDIMTAREILQKTADLLTEDATVSCSIEKGAVLFTIDGGNASVLIGKRGKTLKAMQHIAEKVVRKNVGDTAEVRVDVENYLEKRENALKTLASKLAEKARQTGKPATVNSIDSYERKIIHDALRNDSSVKTRSIGSGDFRRVVIQPGRMPRRKKGAR